MKKRYEKDTILYTILLALVGIGMFLQIAFVIGYFIIGFFQIFAVVDGILYATNIGTVPATIIAVVTTYIPFIGPVLGSYGAVMVWNWELWQAVALFFWFVPVFILLSIFSFLFERPRR